MVLIPEYILISIILVKSISCHESEDCILLYSVNYAVVDMTDQTWTVVRFIDEDTVEAVPSTWIIQNQCYWPPFKYEKIVSLIRKNDRPNTCWPSHEISVFRNSTVGKYILYSVLLLYICLICV